MLNNGYNCSFIHVLDFTLVDTRRNGNIINKKKSLLNSRLRSCIYVTRIRTKRAKGSRVSEGGVFYAFQSKRKRREEFTPS